MALLVNRRRGWAWKVNVWGTIPFTCWLWQWKGNAQVKEARKSRHGGLARLVRLQAIDNTY